MKEYIERASALNALKIARGYCPCAYDEITRIPAADVVEVRHGRWNNINPTVLKPGINWVCRCSLCGCPQDYKHNYCPNCGALMDGKEG